MSIIFPRNISILYYKIIPALLVDQFSVHRPPHPPLIGLTISKQTNKKKKCNLKRFPNNNNRFFFSFLYFIFNDFFDRRKFENDSVHRKYAKIRIKQTGHAVVAEAH